MATILVPDVIGVNIRAKLLSEPVENTFYVERTGGWSQVQIQAVVDAVSAEILANMLDGFTPQWLGTEVYAKDLSVLTGAQASNSDIEGVAGTNAGTVVDGSQSLAIARRSGLAGRSARGRIYWMGIAFNVISNNLVTQTHVDFLVDRMNDLHTVLESTGGTEVIVSRFTGGLPRATGVTFPVLLYLNTNRRVDSQHNRLPKE